MRRRKSKAKAWIVYAVLIAALVGSVVIYFKDEAPPVKVVREEIDLKDK